MNEQRALQFFGANALAYKSHEPEILLAGPAGTGKSFVLLAKCLTMLDKYPGCRGLFCRGTRTSLTQSGLVTWEDKILGRGHPLLTKRPITRRVRQSYECANGSEFVVCGLDDPGKTLSAEYDFVYIQEATEEGIKAGHYETLLRLLRNDRMPYSQLMMDCNPTTPHHWIYQRQANGGLLKMYTSRHRDNPHFWDREKQQWTPAGAKYLSLLDRMSGTRRNRFLNGVWMVASGLVYDYRPEPELDPQTGAVTHPGHLLPVGWLPPKNWKRVWAIDWGLSAPTVLQMWAVDEQWRMYLYREMFRTHLRPDVLGRWAKERIETGEEPFPVAVVCDHDEKNKKQFEDASGLSLELADKTERDRGIETTQERFDLAVDGRPRIFFVPNAREGEPDPRLSDQSRPASTVAEIAAYSWDEDELKDSPIDENDHGCDALRYACRWVDSNLVSIDPNWKQPATQPLLPRYMR